MVLRATFLCLTITFVSLVYSQHFDHQHHATLQEMIDYSKQFEYNHKRGPQSTTETVESSQLGDDPVLKELFTEFLAQYRQLASEQKKEAPSTTIATTTAATTTEAPFRIQFPAFPTNEQNTVQRRKPVFYNAQPALETTTATPKRRLSPRRKSNNPVATRTSLIHHESTNTPFSTLLVHKNFPHHDSTIETTTTFQSLRQKYFAVPSQVTNRPPSPKVHQHSPLAFQITPVPEIVTEEPVVTSEATKSVPRFQTPQNLPKTDTKVPSRAPSKIETEPKFDEKEFRRQAESAKYEFASEISGNLHQREEVRDGLAVKGKYSYSDGYYKRTVHYEADEKGYRVVKEEVQPLEGPQTNPEGHAKVSSYVDGNTIKYQITKDDILKKNQKSVFNEFQDEEDNQQDN